MFKRLILLVTVAAMLAVMLVVTAAPAFAQGQGSRPGIGGVPPGAGERNPSADTNPSVDNRTEPTTGGKSPFTQE